MQADRLLVVVLPTIVLTTLSTYCIFKIRKTTALGNSIQQTHEEWEELLNFWFSGEGSRMWFLQDGKARDSADGLIRSKYLNVFLACEKGEKNWWFEKSARGALALILVLDQFVRHIYRGNEERIEKNGICARGS